MADGDDDEDKRARRAAWNRGFADAVPHNRALGIEIVDLTPGVAIFRMPYDARFVGNPDTGVLHGGVLTAMLDACCGASVIASLGRPAPIATLDLRIDYLRPATPHKDIFSRATCYRTTRNVAFTRAVAYHDDADDPIASAAGTFMLSTKLGPSQKPTKERP
jgi:uncharacterized protein (TIGR00369 family)